MLTSTEKAALQAARNQRFILNRAQEDYDTAVASCVAVGAQKIDGMPHGNSVPHGLETGYIAVERQKKTLERETALFEKYERRARAVMTKMEPALYGFCLFFYLQAKSTSETAAAINRSERQCQRYRRETKMDGVADDDDDGAGMPPIYQAINRYAQA